MQIKSSKDLTKEISKFVSGGLHPFSVCEEDGFKKLITNCLGPERKLQLPSRKQVAAQVDKDYENFKAELKATFQKLDFLSITADVWTAFKRLVMI